MVQEKRSAGEKIKAAFDEILFCCQVGIPTASWLQWYNVYAHRRRLSTADARSDMSVYDLTLAFIQRQGATALGLLFLNERLVLL